MTTAELRTHIDELSARLHRLAPQHIATQAATGYTRKHISQSATHAEHVEPLTAERIASLRREVADVFTVLAKQYARPCGSHAAEAMAGDDASAIEHLCKLLAVARDFAKGLA